MLRILKISMAWIVRSGISECYMLRYATLSIQSNSNKAQIRSFWKWYYSNQSIIWRSDPFQISKSKIYKLSLSGVSRFTVFTEFSNIRNLQTQTSQNLLQNIFCGKIFSQKFKTSKKAYYIQSLSVSREFDLKSNLSSRFGTPKNMSCFGRLKYKFQKLNGSNISESQLADELGLNYANLTSSLKFKDMTIQLNSFR